MALVKEYRNRRLNEYANVDWNTQQTIYTDGSMTIPSADAQLAILQDIRRELQTLNRLLGCARFTGIPTTLNAIRTNTTKRTRRKAMR